jgi:hypothetical protein
MFGFRCPKGMGFFKTHKYKYVYGNHGDWRVCSNCGQMEIRVGSGRTWYWKVIECGNE